MWQLGQSVVIEPKGKAEVAVVWLHGMMDEPVHWSQKHGRGQAERLSSWKWVLPRAPHLPITYLDGKSAAAWGDCHERTSVDVGSVDHEREDCILPELVAEVHDIIHALNKDDGLPFERIVVAGFSQGAALAVEAVLTFPHRLGGQALLCGWLPPGARAALATSPNCCIPTFIGHSRTDKEVDFKCAEFLHCALAEAGAPINFQILDCTDHIPTAFQLASEAVMFLADTLAVEDHSDVAKSETPSLA